MNLKYSSIILLVVLLTGCGVTPNRPDLSLVSNDPDGIIVFSTASVQSCSVHGIDMHLREPGSSNTISRYLVTNPYIKDDFPETRGRLFSAKVPAGRYHFKYSQSHPFLVIHYEVPFVDFHVEPGKITYLGEIVLDGCLDIDSTTVDDKYERDIALFKQLYPDFAATNIEKNMLLLTVQVKAKNESAKQAR